MTKPIDGSDPSKTSYPECDEASGVCGATPKPEAQVSKPDPLVSNIDENFHEGVMLPEDRPSHLAEVARNMSKAKPPAPPPPPTDAELRATYQKMSDAELEKEVNTLGKRLSDGGQYSGADLDTRKFHAAEAVAKSRADAARPPPKEVEEGWHDHEWQTAIKTDGTVKYGEASAALGTSHTGFQVSGRHEHTEWHGHGLDFTADDHVAVDGADAGLHNSDGSWGVHESAGVAVASWEGTLSKKGVGSVTFGASAGASEQVSVGVCLPFWRM